MARMHPFYKEDEIKSKINGPGYVGERELYRLLRDMPGTEKWDVLYNDRFHHGKKDSHCCRKYGGKRKPEQRFSADPAQQFRSVHGNHTQCYRDQHHRDNDHFEQIEK